MHLDQWNRIENPKMNPCLCSQLIFSKWNKGVNGIGETSPLCYSMHKNQSKCIKDLNVGPAWN